MRSPQACRIWQRVLDVCYMDFQEAVEKLKEAAHARNPRAEVVVTDSVITVEDPKIIEGKRVVTVDDGPTITHGGMAYGAGQSFACTASIKHIAVKNFQLL